MFRGCMSELGVIEMVIGESVIIGASLRVSLSTWGNDCFRTLMHWRRAASSFGDGTKGIVLYFVARAAALGCGGLGIGNEELITPRTCKFCQLRMHGQKMFSHMSARDLVAAWPS